MINAYAEVQLVCLVSLFPIPFHSLLHAYNIHTYSAGSTGTCRQSSFALSHVPAAIGPTRHSSSSSSSNSHHAKHHINTRSAHRPSLLSACLRRASTRCTPNVSLIGSSSAHSQCRGILALCHDISHRCEVVSTCRPIHRLTLY